MLSQIHKRNRDITMWDIASLSPIIGNTRNHILILAQYYAVTRRPERACEILEKLVDSKSLLLAQREIIENE